MGIFRGLWNRRRMSDELDEEIRSHLRMDAKDRMERGERTEDAERNARRKFGNELLIRETARDMWGWQTVDRAAQDVRFVVRQIRRSPGFAAIATLTLALGLGATTAMFSIVNGVLLRPLPFRDPARLYAAENIPL